MLSNLYRMIRFGPALYRSARKVRIPRWRALWLVIFPVLVMACDVGGPAFSSDSFVADTGSGDPDAYGTALRDTGAAETDPPNGDAGDAGAPSDANLLPDIPGLAQCTALPNSPPTYGCGGEHPMMTCPADQFCAYDDTADSGTWAQCLPIPFLCTCQQTYQCGCVQGAFKGQICKPGTVPIACVVVNGEVQFRCDLHQ